MKTTDELPVGDEKKAMVQSMFDDIAPTYEKTNTFITFGLDKRARRIALKQLRAAPGSIIVDLASGTGDFSRMLSSHGLIPVACDFSYGMLENAHDTVNRVQCDGSKLPFETNSVDGVVCGYALRNFVDLGIIFDEIMRVTKDGGRFVAIDVCVPTNKLLRWPNHIWIGKVVPKIGWAISRNKKAYEYLPKSTAYLPDPEIIEKMLVESGAENVSITHLVGGSLIMVVANKKIQVNDE